MGIVLLAVCDLPALRVRRGDVIRFDPAISALPRLKRGPLEVDLVNTGAILGAFTDGALRPLTPVPAEVLRALVG